ncbi:MAG TPA: metalloregulator ArsR/SmtB family transcription factor [Jatrophihabitans sp.]|nr:metalloregulator ArsR/SmtB family transcription factor [Jatrophihabitans sp.]
MIEMHLRAADLAETTFTISPMQETVFSLWVWRRPGRQPMHLPWRSAQLAAWRELDTETLDALVAPTMWVPDFLTPRGSELLADFDDELAAVRATPPRRVRADILRTYGDATPPQVLRGKPSQVLERITAALADYWQACLHPFWPRIRAVLEADVVHGSRQLAASGAAGLFGALDARVRWDDGILTVDRKIAERRYLEVAGRGVRLSPSLFCRGAVTYIDLDEPPWIVYPARGRATVWEKRNPPAPSVVADLLGRTRAGLLALLAEPMTTTELARRTEVTPSAVSQHLRVLREGGLVNRARSGRSVLYLRSELADQLLGRRVRPRLLERDAEVDRAAQ